MEQVQQPVAVPNWNQLNHLILPALLGLAVFAFTLYAFPLGGEDWRFGIAPAARSPFFQPWAAGPWRFPLPPWAAVLFAPFAMFPDNIAPAITNGLAVVVFALVIRKLGGPRWALFPVLLSSPAFMMFIKGQSEWLVLAGLLLPAGYDLIPIALKPQVAGFVFVPRFKKNGVKYLLPIAVLVSVSLFIWPLWPVGVMSYTPMLVSGWWNYSLWPWSIPLGLYFLFRANKNSDDVFGIIASPLLFPYVGMASYLGLMIAAFARWPRAWFTWVLLVASWLVYFTLPTSAFLH